MIIGIPKEILHDEHRVAATPETAGKLIKDGFQVCLESGAGLGSYFTDQAYEQTGVRILENAQNIYEQSDVILKVKEPQYSQQYQCYEYDLMHKDQILITFLHPASPANHRMIKSLATKGITSLTLDSIPRTAETKRMDALVSMSVCAGYKGMIMAACELKRFMPAVVTSSSIGNPAHVLVIGAGVAGLQALETAKGLGAILHAADISPEALKRAHALGASLISLPLPESSSDHTNRLAKQQDEAWLARVREVLSGAISSMDIVFCSVLVPGHRAPVLITAEMVRCMQPGSVIVDVSIDQGGNCELTDAGKMAVRNEVSIIGIKNLPGLLASSSTSMFAENVYELVKHLSSGDLIQIDPNDSIVASMLTTVDGQVVHKPTLEAMAVQ